MAIINKAENSGSAGKSKKETTAKAKEKVSKEKSKTDAKSKKAASQKKADKK